MHLNDEQSHVQYVVEEKRSGLNPHCHNFLVNHVIMGRISNGYLEFPLRDSKGKRLITRWYITNTLSI